MFDSFLRSQHHVEAEIHPPICAADLTVQHQALAQRMVQVFQRGDTEPPSIACAGHCVFVRTRHGRFCVTIANDRLLLVSSADNSELGRFSTPAGVCRHIVQMERGQIAAADAPALTVAEMKPPPRTRIASGAA